MIIHSPIFSGSINQAASAYANLSGSFTGSFKGIGDFEGLVADSVEYANVTNKPELVSGSSQISFPGLSNIPSGIISSSAQIDTLFNIDGLVSGGGQQDYIPLFKSTNELSSSYLYQDNNELKTFAPGINKGLGLSFINDEYFLGNSTSVTGSYVTANARDGIVTIKSNNYTNIQNKLSIGGLTIGDEELLVSGSIRASEGVAATSFSGQILANNGVISGSTQVQFNDITNNPFSHSASNITIPAGKKIRSADENTIVIAENIDVEGNITLLGAVDGVDIAAFKIDFDAFKAQTLVSGSGQLTSSYDNRYVTLTGDQTIGSTKTFNNINVNGTASFAYIQSTTGSSTSIGEAFIVLNESTPSSNFAGIKVVDSGSTFTTASFVYDGLNNNWVFEKAGGDVSGSSLTIFGPVSNNGLGTEVGLTENRVPKAVTTHGHHIGDSNITDNGTTITLGSNTVVTGTIVASGTSLVSGSSQITYASISSIPAGIVSGSSQITAGSTTNFATDVKTQLNSNTVISGSSQVTLSSTTGYGTVINQNLLTTSNVQHNSLGIGMAASATAGRIDATNDVVAYSSSDIRFKENIKPIENALDKISKISGNTYDWKEENKIEHGYEGNDVGVIAQEIEAVLPQLVQTRESGYKAVKYDKLVALLIEGIKEQQKQIDELKSKLQ
jgi:hypothetical protein